MKLKSLFVQLTKVLCHIFLILWIILIYTLLVENDGISDAVKRKIAEIKPIRVYIIGGQAVISSVVEDQIAELTPLGKGAIVRPGGVDRYETSLTVANYFKLSGQTVCVATGNNFLIHLQEVFMQQTSVHRLF